MDESDSGFRPISPDLADPTIAARQRAAEMEELKKSSKMFANNLAKMDQSDSSNNGFTNFTSTNQKLESKKDTISSIREAAEQRRMAQAQQYQSESGTG